MSEYATLAQRIVAGVIDQVLMLIVIAIMLVLGFFSFNIWGYLFLIALSYMLWILYFTYFEGTSGQTIGKRVLGIRVTMRDGSEPGFVIAFIRTIFRIIDSLPFFYIIGILMILISSENQRLGDMVAGTIVVED